MYGISVMIQHRVTRILLVLFPVMHLLASDQILEVPKTAVKPVIDGRMDNVWLNVPGTSMQKTCYQVSNTWADLSGMFRFMWDDDNLYFYIQVIDNMLRYDWGYNNAYEDDGFELFFDADHSKGIAFDQTNDIQLRFNYGWGHAYHLDTGFGNPRVDWGFSDAGISYWMQDTEYGYDYELKMPSARIKLPSEAGHLFGLELQVNDNDYGSRKDILKWWSESNDSWMNPSLFGTARLSGEVVSDTLKIPFTENSPQIDGYLDDKWDTASLVTLNHHTRVVTPPSSRIDCGGIIQCMWDPDYLYLFCQAIDQTLMNDGGDTWENDGFEFYVDGDYSHEQNYDYVDDTQYIFCWSSNAADVAQGPLGTENFIMKQKNNSDGWQTEIAMPLKSIHIEPENGHIFGLEFTYNDDDNGGSRDHQMHYWDTEDMSWMNPSTFATAKLIGGPPPAVMYGDVDLNKIVQAYDAAVLLKSLVGIVQLTPAQIKNADVSLDGTVSALDASLILQYRVGLIDTLPNPVLMKSSVFSTPLAFGEVSRTEQGLIEIPVSLSEYISCTALECAIGYDPDALYFHSMEWSGSFQSAMTQLSAMDQTIRLACAMERKVDSIRNIGVLRFSPLSDIRSEVIFVSARVDENPVQNVFGATAVVSASTGVDSQEQAPESFRLHDNYPNPFNPSTTIAYQLPEACYVELAVFNLAGQQVDLLVNTRQQAGHHTAVWTAKNLEAGIYFYRLKAGTKILVRKMTVLK
jgi:hypothetical protein